MTHNATGIKALDALTHPRPNERQLLVRWAVEVIEPGYGGMLTTDRELWLKIASTAFNCGLTDMVELVIWATPTQRARMINDVRRALELLFAQYATGETK